MMTRCQADCLSVIKHYYRVYGVPPTVREVAEFMGYPRGSHSTVHVHIRNLTNAGHLRRHGDQAAYIPTGMRVVEDK